MKKMRIDTLVSATLVLSKYFSKYDLAYAFECREADIESIYDGYRDGWDDCIIQFAQDVLSRTELPVDAMRDLLSRVSQNNPTGVEAAVGEITDRDQELYDYAYAMGFQIALAVRVKETEYDPMISSETVEDILQKYPFDNEFNMYMLDKNRGSGKLTNDGEYLEMLPDYLDESAGILGKDVVERLKKRVPYVELRELLKPTLNTLSKEQTEYLKESLTYIRDHYLDGEEAVFEAILKDGISRGFLKKPDIEIKEMLKRKD